MLLFNYFKRMQKKLFSNAFYKKGTTKMGLKIGFKGFKKIDNK